jgi:hypothetical protein
LDPDLKSNRIQSRDRIGFGSETGSDLNPKPDRIYYYKELFGSVSGKAMQILDPEPYYGFLPLSS